MTRASFLVTAGVVVLAVSVGSACSSTEQDARAAVCAELDDLSPEEMDKIFTSAEAALGRAGVQLDGNAWNDPDKFQAYFNEVDKITKCSTLASRSLGRSAQALVGVEEDFCGPGHGATAVRTDGQLNTLCQAHDACYAACSGATSFTCSWVPATHACDDPFLEAARSLRDNKLFVDAKFRSRAVVWFAGRLYDVGYAQESRCVDASMVCPPSVNEGRGPCVEPTTPALKRRCAACTEFYDPGGACLERACADEPSPLCYASNCSVAPCFGGYDELVWGATDAGGAPDAGDAGDAGPVDASVDAGGSPPLDPASLWDVIVVDGAVPTTKTWDADLSPPDPFVTVTVGNPAGTSAKTSTVQDQYAPFWNQIVISGATASSIKAYVAFAMYDSDIASDDLVGACSVTFADANFSSTPTLFTLPCPAQAPPAGPEQAGFSLRYYLRPHQ